MQGSFGFKVWRWSHDLGRRPKQCRPRTNHHHC